MMSERFTERSVRIMVIAQEEARRLGHSFLGTEQFLLGLIGEGESIGAQVLKSRGLTLKNTRIEVENLVGRGSGRSPVELPFTERAKQVLTFTVQESRQLGHNFIGTEHILLGLIREEEGIAARVLNNLGVDRFKVRNDVVRLISDASTVLNPERSQQLGRGAALRNYGTDLTREAAQGKLDPVIGRETEVQRVVQILGRRTKNNPVLLGKAGVGKTTIAEGLAVRIIEKSFPPRMQDNIVAVLDLSLLTSGSKYRGEFEARLRSVMFEVKRNKKIIVMIDEIHTLVGSGNAEGAVDTSQLLKLALARGEFKCIGATTVDEFRKHIQEDAALERRFQPVKVPEPSTSQTVQILKGLRRTYEKHHHLVISDEALVAAVKYSKQYITNRYLPDKAIDLIDEACSALRLANSDLPNFEDELLKEL